MLVVFIVLLMTHGHTNVKATIDCYMKVPVVSDSIAVTSKMDQSKLGRIDQNEDSGNAVLSVENGYWNTEEGSVKDVRKPRSEEISRGL